MSRIIHLVFVLISICLLSACMPRQDYTYIPPETDAGKNCAASCKIASTKCVEICALKNSICRSEMRRTAESNYNAYKMRRQATNSKVGKSLDDFMRTAGCVHSCNCIPAFNTCYSACGGKVY